MIRNLFCMIVVFAVSQPVYAQQSSSPLEGGKWVTRGTFALSNLSENLKRNKSYARAGEEKERIFTFLPGMTIVYQTKRSEINSGYIEGTTHSGIQVQVPKNELSSGQFNTRREKDVVVHFSHRGCRELSCSGDEFQVGSGESYEIIFEDKEKIELLNRSVEKSVIYSPERFNDLELRGFLTRHKGRVNPRWRIFDGYAAKLSTGCGEQRSPPNLISVAKSKYHADPSTWSISDDSWSLKAIELMGLGSVVENNNTGNYDGVIDQAIIHESDPENTAIDLTIFAYRDSSWKPTSYFKFAGIAQVVKCRRANLGRLAPSYVSFVDIYFDIRSGDGYTQDFPLPFYSLESLYTEENREKLFSYHNRSFFYSINNSGQYLGVFEDLSKVVPYPNAVAHIIARLNASCSQSDRKRCRVHSKLK